MTKGSLTTVLETRRAGFLCLLLALFPASPLAAQGPRTAKGPDFSRVRKLIQDRITADSIPSVAVAVARNGEILWEEGFGWADRENRVAATEHTMYYLASVTKSITATGVMVLSEKKKLNLDRPVNDYLGAARLSSPLWDPAGATVRRVAAHTAGLTTFARTCFAGPAACRISQDETIRRYGVVFWPPGDHFDYSNLGYGILGAAAARVSGKSYDDFLRSEVFRPLGMTHASLGIAPGLEKYAAKRYSQEFGVRPAAVSGTPGASAAYCSAHDLALFGLFHLKTRRSSQKAILSNASIDAMQEPTSDRYGLGFWINKDLFGYRGVMAQGGTDDAFAILQLIPSERIAVVVLANTGTTMPGTVVEEVLSILLPDYREEREKRAAAAGKGGETPRPKSDPPSPSLVGNWAGAVKTHRGDIPLKLSIAVSGEVHAQLGSQVRTPVDRAGFDKDSLTGLFSGDLGTEEDTGPDPYDLDLEMYVRGGALAGAVTTRPRPGARRFARLPYWVELKRETGGV